MIVKLPILSTATLGDHILALLRGEGNTLSLISFNRRLEVEGRLVTMRGYRGFILDVYKDSILFAVDDKLYVLREGGLKHVLQAHHPTNHFWHAARAGDLIYVQEYGESPTGIYMLTKDYENPHLLVTNKELDRGSRHFHNVVYDRFRGWLITTLGDGNLVRVAVSMDGGKSWHPLYRGPWQFVPIAPLSDRIVFGMDSGIAGGGIGVHYPDEKRWQFIFLK